MGDFIRWYLKEFGSKDFIGLWLAWLGFVTLCAIELKRGFTDPSYQVSTVFTTVLGGVIGYVVRGTGNSSEAKKPDP